MTLQVIPTFSDPSYSQATTLDGVQYLLKFRYNQRENTWGLGFYKPDGTVLISYIKLTCGTDLLKPTSYNADLPPGNLFVYPKGTDDSLPGLYDLEEEGRCQLVYVTAT